MPEGPETHRAAAQLARVLAGRTALEVRLELDRLKRHQRQLSGRRIDSVKARGKATLVGFAGGWVLYSHNQLYGRWVISKNGAFPETGRSLRVSIRTDAGHARLYSASDIDVLKERDLEGHPYLARLGPDAVDPETTPDDIEARLADARFAGRALGSLLLDQSYVSGLGNYLRSEILYVSRIAHDRRPASLDENERARLARALLRIPRRSLASRGVTVPREEYRARRKSGLTRGEARFHVFDREGTPCPECGRLVRREAVAGRRLYRCPGCQPLTRRAGRGR